MKEAEQVSPAEWVIVADHPHADCTVFSVVRREAFHPLRNTRANFFVGKAMDGGMALAETEGGAFVLVRQYRFGARKLSWEFPAGCMDAGEEPISAARRELLEETGYAGGEAEIIGWCHPNPAIQENTCWYVHIRGVRSGAATQWDPHEELESRLVPLPEVERMAASGEIFHGIAQAALFALRRKDGL